MTEFASSRKDGRGHWTPGKPRSDASDTDVRRTLAAIRRANERDKHSLRSIARTVGVSDRAVRRWLSGDHRPTAENCADVLAHYPAPRRS